MCLEPYSCANIESETMNIEELLCFENKSCYNSSIIINPSNTATKTVKILCKGKYSCENTFLKASDIKMSRDNGVTSFICDNKYACYNSNWYIIGEPLNGCKVNCIGFGSCCQVGNYVGNPKEFSQIFNIKEFKCIGDYSCSNSSFALFNDQINRNINIEINGINALKNSDLLVYSLNNQNKPIQSTLNIICKEYHSCSYTQIGTVVSKVNIECNANSCFGNFIDRLDGGIILTNSYGKINCIGIHSCNGFIILNTIQGPFANPGDNVEVGGYFTDINCIGRHSCQNAVFITQCHNDKGCKIVCKGEKSCSNFLFSGVFGVTLFECDGIHACYNTMNPISIRDQFLLKCASQSCSDVNFEFIIDPYSQYPNLEITNYHYSGFKFIAPSDEVHVNQIKGIDCSGKYACANSIFKFIIYSGDNNIGIEHVKCGDITSCSNTTFIFETYTINAKWEFNVNKVFQCSGSCNNINKIIINGIRFESFNLHDTINDINLHPNIMKHLPTILVGLTALIILICCIIIAKLIKRKPTTYNKPTPNPGNTNNNTKPSNNNTEHINTQISKEIIHFVDNETKTKDIL